MQLTIFADGKPRIKPLLIFRGTGKRIPLGMTVLRATFGPNVALQPPGWPDTVPALSRRGYRPPSLGYRAPTLAPVGTQSPSPAKWSCMGSVIIHSYHPEIQLHLCHHLVSDSTSTSSCHPGSPNPWENLLCPSMSVNAICSTLGDFYFCYSTLCPILQLC